MAATVETRAGRIEGREERGLSVFRGIPYAAPPVGPLRWQPPQPPEPWAGVRACHEFGPVAPQNPIELATLEAFNVAEPQSEDCLYLNVWTPGLDDERRPVLVWIHGGAFSIGSGSQFIYDGAALARRGDVVVVTLNYRLGPLGFLNLSELTGGRIPATGNEGLLDQVAALEWVRDHVAAFGGDPGNVTIFGESAGGMSCGALLGLPAASGLFRRAIPQSGACHTASPLPRAVRAADRFLGTLGLAADDVGGLQAATPAQLLAASGTLSAALANNADPELQGMPMQPTIDGQVLPRRPIDAVVAGSARGVDVFAGSTLDEWRLFAPADPGLLTLDDEGLYRRVGAFARSAAVDLIEGYRKARSARGAAVSPTELFLAIETDRIFRIPALRLAQAQGAHADRAHAYLFTWASPLMDGLLGSCHALELGFVFGTYDASEAMRAFSGQGSAADALALAVQDSWLAFARTGDPTNERVGQVPPYDGPQRPTLVLGEKCGVEGAPLERERALWDSVDDACLGSG